MDSLTSLSITGTSDDVLSASTFSPKNNLNALITTHVLSTDAASMNVEFDDLYKSLTITSQEILNRLNEILADKVPNGIESLTPEDHTPEKTAETIVSGIANLFDGYAKSNAELEPEELINRFIAAAKQGVSAGYDDAFSTLKDLGAFDIDGVQDGVEQTRGLIDSKLAELENKLRQQYGLEPKNSDADTETVTNPVATSVSTGVLSSAGTSINGTGNATVKLDLSA